MSASDVVQIGDDSMVIVGGQSSASGTNANTSMASIGMASPLTASQRQGEDVVDEDSNEEEEQSNSQIAIPEEEVVTEVIDPTSGQKDEPKRNHGTIKEVDEELEESQF